MTLKILERNSEGKITKFNWNGTDFTPDKPIEEKHLLNLVAGHSSIKLANNEGYLAFTSAGGAALPTSIPANATFAEVLQQAEDSKDLFIGNYVRDKISANLLEHIGDSKNRGTYYNSGTTWRDLFSIVNAYISPDLEQDLFDYLMGKLGENIVLKVVFGDNRVDQRDRISSVYTITELDKEYTFALEQSGVAWSYDLIIEIRSSDNKTKFKIQHGVSAGNRSKHGDQYGAIRGLWFEEIT